MFAQVINVPWMLMGAGIALVVLIWFLVQWKILSRLDSQAQRQQQIEQAMIRWHDDFVDSIDAMRSGMTHDRAQVMTLVQQQVAQEEQRMVRLSEDLRLFQTQVRAELDRIHSSNQGALNAMRETVDVKLQENLTQRISASFEGVQNQLLAVHRGLGEMKQLAANVDGLNRVLTNVKTRGIFGEVQLKAILTELLPVGQYLENVPTRPNSTERVEFALRLPGSTSGSEVLLPIDAKFPIEDYYRLQQARTIGDDEGIRNALKALERRIFEESRKIREKYVEVPYTTDFAILFLPVESLYFEVLQIDGLLERIQRVLRISIVGPSVLGAYLNSLQMGFQTLAISQKSAEVWQLLSEVKSEFDRFEQAFDLLEKRLASTDKALEAMKTRSAAMTRRLKAVQSPTEQSISTDRSNSSSVLPLAEVED